MKRLLKAILRHARKLAALAAIAGIGGGMTGYAQQTVTKISGGTGSLANTLQADLQVANGRTLTISTNGSLIIDSGAMVSISGATFTGSFSLSDVTILGGTATLSSLTVSGASVLGTTSISSLSVSGTESVSASRISTATISTATISALRLGATGTTLSGLIVFSVSASGGVMTVTDAAITATSVPIGWGIMSGAPITTSASPVFAFNTGSFTATVQAGDTRTYSITIGVK